MYSEMNISPLKGDKVHQCNETIDGKNTSYEFKCRAAASSILFFYTAVVNFMFVDTVALRYRFKLMLFEQERKIF